MSNNDLEVEKIETTVATVTVYKKKGYVVHDCYPKRYDNIAEMQSYLDDCNALISKYAPIACYADGYSQGERND